MVATRMGFIQVRWCVGSSRHTTSVKTFYNDVDSVVYTRERLLVRVTLFDAGGVVCLQVGR